MESVEYSSFEEALERAGDRVLYVYVSPSIDVGWFAGGVLPERLWYEDIVIADRTKNCKFLDEIGANDDFVLIGISFGFVLFRAHSMDELLSNLKLVRGFSDKLVKQSIKAGRLVPPDQSK